MATNPFTYQDLKERALEIALTQVGVRESSRNRGRQVDKYHLACGADPAKREAWCVRFVRYCYQEAADILDMRSPLPRTSGVLRLWELAPDIVRVKELGPCDIFIIDKGGGKGHAGIVEMNSNHEVHTVEGNTDYGGEREGDGVYYRKRKIGEILGFLDYGRYK